MKKIEAVIRPGRLTEVLEALLSIGLDGLTMTEIRGFGASSSGPQYRGAVVDVAPVIALAKVEVVVPDFKVSQTVEAIRRAARTGQRDDGRISIVPIDDVLRVRTGETGEAAL